ncbi:hypothetical protein [Burkholderia plantarii]|uniref:hypothetical protein n=1 Tax=Burkholderia plantarii TaxID=41899 RepID=UPI0018DAF800|nr:hypothetical protein [Burkholderia plantarii]MBI0325889.1 hypothetical protein [Burkholderia plantarii]
MRGFFFFQFGNVSLSEPYRSLRAGQVMASEEKHAGSTRTLLRKSIPHIPKIGLIDRRTAAHHDGDTLDSPNESSTKNKLHASTFNVRRTSHAFNPTKHAPRGRRRAWQGAERYSFGCRNGVI